MLPDTAVRQAMGKERAEDGGMLRVSDTKS